MYRSYEEKVLVIARRMIYAFYVDRDIDTIISYLDPNNFIYTCANTNQTVVGAENMREFLSYSLITSTVIKLSRKIINFAVPQSTVA